MLESSIINLVFAVYREMEVGKLKKLITLTVRDVLNLNIFHGVSLCAGKDGLSRSVSGITTTEDSGLPDWLKGGEILLISLHNALDFFTSERELYQLASKGVAALMIKSGPDFLSIPDDLIRLGNLLSIPVLLLPQDVRFIDAISSVISLISQKKNEHYMQVQNKLTKLLTSGAHEEDILHYLTGYIPAQISLTDASGTIIFSSWSPEFHPDLPVGDRIKFPIMCMGKVNGYLEAVSNRFLEDILEAHLKTASNLFSVLALKKYYIAEVEQTYISDFLRDLFDNRLNEQTIIEKSKRYGWNKTDHYLTIIIELSSAKTISRIPEALMEITPFLPIKNFFFYIKEPYLHILYKETPSDFSDPYTRTLQVLSSINKYIDKKYRTLSLYAGISSIAHEVTAIPQKVKEAFDALQFGHAFENHIVKYQDMGVLKLLASQSSITNFEQIIPPSVQKLAAYDKANNTQYLETLDSLLGNNLNLSKTAKQLFIHYKTMLHRMNRICEIAEISLDDQQTRLDVELGVKLYMMIPK